MSARAERVKTSYSLVLSHSQAGRSGHRMVVGSKQYLVSGIAVNDLDPMYTPRTNLPFPMLEVGMRILMLAARLCRVNQIFRAGRLRARIWLYDTQGHC